MGKVEIKCRNLDLVSLFYLLTSQWNLRVQDEVLKFSKQNFTVLIMLWSRSTKQFTLFQARSWLLLKQTVLFWNIYFLIFTEAFLPKYQVSRISFSFQCVYIHNTHPLFTLWLLFTLSPDSFFCQFRRHVFNVLYLFN